VFMRFSKYLFTGIWIACAFPAFCQTPVSPNLLLIHSNSPIAFDKVDSKLIRNAVDQLIKLTDVRVRIIISGLKPGAGPGTTLSAYDELSYDLNDLGMKLGLIAQTYLSDSVRAAANDGLQALSDYQTTLVLNESLYKALKKYAAISMANLKPNQQKFVSDQIRIFENNGMKLDSSGRKELQVISDRITMLALEFDKNIATSRDSIVFSETAMEGVPDAQKTKWKRPSGEYVIYINTPNYVDISKYAASDDTRKKMLVKYLNRAYPQNMKVLDSMLYYRRQYALKLGYNSYAAYALTDKMAGNPEAVWDFENYVVEKLAPQVTADITEMRSIKHQMHPELPDSIYTWDVQYYKKQLLDTKYQLNSDEVKQYFEMNQTISGMFEVYHQLLGITVKETSGWPSWYSKVRSFEMYVGTKKVGSFYFDLYPRQNKYTHFACFGISSANNNGGREILPVSALICNFPEAAQGNPTLLDHSDVITLFHEFGHLVHSMVVRSDLASQPGTLKADFVEAPSQFLENFCWQYASLKVFAKNYKTGAVLPESLFNKMKATEHVQDALYYTQQIYYGMIDFTFEDKYDSIRGKDLNEVSKNLYRITQIPFTEGSHMIAAFNHLSGYGANYYGYLWSRVFAQDIFSIFEKNGVMDSKTGERYRKEILEVAGSQQEMDMLRHFLGREPNSDAFMKSIGL
ncbi:MAG: Zn-dependent oligopeptidase, partial [Bacteroidota bacterium]|nr:Zn-dependent oligopeptidase [Bacteroidota bacterium]